MQLLALCMRERERARGERERERRESMVVTWWIVAFWHSVKTVCAQDKNISAQSVACKSRSPPMLPMLGIMLSITTLSGQVRSS